MRSPSPSHLVSFTRSGQKSTLLACALFLLGLATLWAISADKWNETSTPLRAAVHPEDGRAAVKESAGTRDLVLPAGKAHSPVSSGEDRDQVDGLAQASGGYQHFATWPLPIASFVPEDVAINNNGYVALCDSYNHRVLYYDALGTMLGQSALPRPPGHSEERCRLTVDANGEDFLLVWSYSGRRIGHAAEDYLELRNQLGELLGGPTIVVDRKDIPVQGRFVDVLHDITLRRDGTLLSMHRDGVFLIDTAAFTETDYIQNTLSDRRPESIAEWRETAWSTSENHEPGGKAQGVFIYSRADDSLVLQLQNDMVIFDIEAGIDRELMMLVAPHDPQNPSPFHPFIRTFDESGAELQSISNSALGGIRFQSDRVEHHRLDRSPDGQHFAITASHERFSIRSHTRDGALRWEVKSLLGPKGFGSSWRGGWISPRVSQFPLPLDLDAKGRLLVLDTRLDSAPLLEFDATGKPRTFYSGDPAHKSSDLAFSSSDEVLLAKPEGPFALVDASGASNDLSFACDCPYGGRLAAVNSDLDGSLAAVYAARPHANEILVGDAALNQVLGRFKLPDADGMWPGDISALASGDLFVADAATREIQRFAPDGQSKVAWLMAGGQAHPWRVDTARLSDGRDMVVALSDEGHVELFESLPDGVRYITRFAIKDLLSNTGYIDDIAIGPDAKIYVSDLNQEAVHVFDPLNGLPEPDPVPTPTPEPGLGDCEIVHDKQAGPAQVLIGQRAEVTLSLRADCPEGSDRLGGDIVIVLDRDPLAETSLPITQALRSELELQAGFVERFVGSLDYRQHRVALVSVDVLGIISTSLKAAPFDSLDVLRELESEADFPVASVSSDKPLLAAEAILDAEGRPNALPLIVYIGSGRPSAQAANALPSQAFQAAIREGQRLLGRGIEIFAFQPEFIGNALGGSDNGEKGLLEIVSNPDRMRRLRDQPIAQELAGRASTEIQDLAGGSLAGSLSIYDEMSSEVTLVPGSAFPPAAEGPTWLIWRRSLLPASGLTLTYEVTPTQLGLIPTNRFAHAEYTDPDGRRREKIFPVPEIEVVTPSPTPTLTPSPAPPASSTPIPVDLFLPLLHRNHCHAPEITGLDIVLLIDASTSMNELAQDGRPKIAHAADAASTFAALLDGRRDRLALVEFNGAVRRLRDLRAPDSDVDQALAQISLIAGTRMAAGLDEARAIFRGAGSHPGRVKVAILLTDGRPTGEPREISIVSASDARSEGIEIRAIGLGDAANLDLELLASLTADPAKVSITSDAAELERILGGLAVELPCR